jgi:AAA+ superfamily predicted ATPase
MNKYPPNKKSHIRFVDYLDRLSPCADSICYNTPQNEFNSAYKKWKEDNEHILDLIVTLESGKKTDGVIREKVIITCKLKTTDDLLVLLQENPYDETKEYNIDLKSLHKIREELETLHNMVGLVKLKTCILNQLLYFIQGFDVMEKNKAFADYKHTIFVGPPGTGKTEVAKIIGKMYSKLGILKKEVFKKVTRTDLIAGYLGQTAIKTRKVIDECIGGVLFIDEAYSLQNDDTYAKECVNTLCEALSDNKQDLMVIVAGYENELNETFFQINKGLRSRFLWKFTMEPYDASELGQIFITKVNQNKWELEFDALPKWMKDRKDKFLYNGRDMEQLFTYVKVSHSHRVYGLDVSEKRKISKEDMDSGFETFLENRKIAISSNISSMYT